MGGPLECKVRPTLLVVLAYCFSSFMNGTMIMESSMILQYQTSRMPKCLQIAGNTDSRWRRINDKELAISECILKNREWPTF